MMILFVLFASFFLSFTTYDENCLFSKESLQGNLFLEEAPGLSSWYLGLNSILSSPYCFFFPFFIQMSGYILITKVILKILPVFSSKARNRMFLSCIFFSSPFAAFHYFMFFLKFWLCSLECLSVLLIIFYENIFSYISYSCIILLIVWPSPLSWL